MRFSKINNKQRGFTLIELLVVIGILAVLLAITLIAINPARQFSQANDTKRTSDVNAILNAINQYMADNAGTPPGTITSTAQEIKDTGGVNLCTLLVARYLAALPSDPKTGTPQGSVPVTGCTGTYNTKYTVKSEANNRITVAATPEIAASISVTR